VSTLFLSSFWKPVGAGRQNAAGIRLKFYGHLLRQPCGLRKSTNSAKVAGDTPAATVTLACGCASVWPLIGITSHFSRITEADPCGTSRSRRRCGTRLRCRRKSGRGRGSGSRGRRSSSCGRGSWCGCCCCGRSSRDRRSYRRRWGRWGAGRRRTRCCWCRTWRRGWRRRANSCRYIDATPAIHIVRRPSCAACSGRNKNSRVVQCIATIQNLVSQAWNSAPKQRHCTGNVRSRHRRAAGSGITSIGRVTSRAGTCAGSGDIWLDTIAAIDSDGAAIAKAGDGICPSVQSSCSVRSRIPRRRPGLGTRSDGVDTAAREA